MQAMPLLVIFNLYSPPHALPLLPCQQQIATFFQIVTRKKDSIQCRRLLSLANVLRTDFPSSQSGIFLGDYALLAL